MNENWSDGPGFSNKTPAQTVSIQFIAIDHRFEVLRSGRSGQLRERAREGLAKTRSRSYAKRCRMLIENAPEEGELQTEKSPKKPLFPWNICLFPGRHVQPNQNQWITKTETVMKSVYVFHGKIGSNFRFKQTLENKLDNKKSVPRTRGDEPPRQIAAFSRQKCSPHARG